MAGAGTHLFVDILLFLLWSTSVDGKNKPVTLRILHTNDIHSHFVPSDAYGKKCGSDQDVCYGGFARLISAVNNVRRSDNNVLLFDGGDQLTKTLWFNVFRGNKSAIYFNRLRYDAVSLGNHEFDYGVQNTIEYLSQLHVPVVASNLDVSQEPRWPRSPILFNHSMVITVESEKIGVCGYTLANTPQFRADLENLKFSDEVESVSKCSKAHTDNGIRIIIAVGHAGIGVDQRIAENVPDVDVVIGGHSNTFLYNGNAPTPNKVQGVYPLVIRKGQNVAVVVQDYGYGIYLGNLSVTFDENGKLTSWSGQPILMDSNAPADKETEAEIKELKKDVDKLAKKIIGKSSVFLDGSNCGWRECSLGNLITDALVSHFAAPSAEGAWAKASIALWTAGETRKSINATEQGDIVYEQAYNAFPFQNTISTVEVYGRVLRQMMEFSVSRLGRERESFSEMQQASGLQVVYDLDQKPYNRIVSILARCLNCTVPKFEPLQDGKIYKILMPLYVAKGGSGYLVVTSFLSFDVGDVYDVDVVAAYTQRISPVTIGVEGRLTFKEGRSDICSAAGGKGLGTSVVMATVATWIVSMVCVDIVL